MASRPSRWGDELPIGTIATILVIAIFCNLALMVAFLLGPLVRRRPSGSLASEGEPGGATGDAAARLDFAPSSAKPTSTLAGSGERAAPGVTVPVAGVDAGLVPSTVESESSPAEADDGAPSSLPADAGPAPPIASGSEGDAGPSGNSHPGHVAAAPEAVPPVRIPEPEPEGEELTEEESEVVDLEQPETEDTERRRRFVFTRHEDPRAMRAIEALLSRTPSDVRRAMASGVAGPASTPRPPATAMLFDEETGLASRLAWELALQDETARHLRYRRPVTVVVADLDGYDQLVQRFGKDAARRLVPPIAATLRRQARAADRLARVGEARFLGLLPETDEIQAINYIERVRVECDSWLEEGAIGARVILGWASPAAGEDLPAALRTAERRVDAERRLPARRTRPADGASS